MATYLHAFGTCPTPNPITGVCIGHWCADHIDDRRDRSRSQLITDMALRGIAAIYGEGCGRAHRDQRSDALEDSREACR